MASDQDIKAKIAKLQRLANDSRAPQGERDAAENRIAALKEKLPKPATKPKIDLSKEELLRMAAAFQNMGKAAQKTDWRKVRITYTPPTQRDWYTVHQQMTAEDEKRRLAAQRAWEARNKQRDDMGRPRPTVDFDEAIRNDPRTQTERQQDIQDRHKQTHIPDVGPRCGTVGQAESYFDQGGERRKRNAYAAPCDRCHNILQPGEGTVFEAGGLWITRCCEQVPGPRPKRKGRS